MNRPQRRLPIGAELQPGGGVHFRVWCPDHPVTVVVERARDAPVEAALSQETGGYWSGRVAGVAAGDCYRYRVGGELLADPASRSQPDGPFGPSEVIDAAAFPWSDSEWRGRSLQGAVIYELHCGTFTQEGTWAAAQEQLPRLAELGVTVVELMPVAEFPGRFGWGYDGVFPYAPTRLYGRPDDFRAFVNRAHEVGLAIILDVVYNHLGPDGCVFARFAQAYFSRKYANEWGEPLNFDDEGSAAVREYFVNNARYWVDEYHLDGLRLDATQAIHDGSPQHVLVDIVRAARDAAGDRQVLLIGENEPQWTRLVRPIEEGGYGLDALWNDDFHHSAIVALTGHREAYYRDHRGTPQELISAARRGFLFQGQRYGWQKQPRGTSTRGVAPAAFVNFLENHDQIANSGDGCRLHCRTTPGRLRAMTALFLLMPGTPMLFQGQEFAASAPFLYFADHHLELASRVQQGRAEFLRQFPSLSAPEMQALLPPPHDFGTFERCRLDWREREAHARSWRLHADLLRLRRTDAAFTRQAPGAVDGAVIAPEALVLRFFGEDERDDRLLVVNLGVDLVTESLAEPLVAPPAAARWGIRWSSEHPEYGGTGTAPPADDDGWRIPGHAAIVLMPELTHGSHGSN